MAEKILGMSAKSGQHRRRVGIGRALLLLELLDHASELTHETTPVVEAQRVDIAAHLELAEAEALAALGHFEAELASLVHRRPTPRTRCVLFHGDAHGERRERHHRLRTGGGHPDVLVGRIGLDQNLEGGYEDALEALLADGDERGGLAAGLAKRHAIGEREVDVIAVVGERLGNDRDIAEVEDALRSHPRAPAPDPG